MPTPSRLGYARRMAIRMDHVSIVVEDLEAGIAFFTELGMEIEGRMPIEGPWVDRINGIDGIRLEIAMMRAPDGQGRVELTKFDNPAATTAEPNAPPNTFGLRSVMFAVDDIRDTIARLEPHGGQVMGEVVRYEDIYLLAYLRGPQGIIVALAEPLSEQARVR